MSDNRVSHGHTHTDANVCPTSCPGHPRFAQMPKWREELAAVLAEQLREDFGGAVPFAGWGGRLATTLAPLVARWLDAEYEQGSRDAWLAMREGAAEVRTRVEAVADEWDHALEGYIDPADGPMWYARALRRCSRRIRDVLALEGDTDTSTQPEVADRVFHPEV